MVILIDTSFLLAAVYAKDKNYQKARAAQQGMKGVTRTVLYGYYTDELRASYCCV